MVRCVKLWDNETGAINVGEEPNKKKERETEFSSKTFSVSSKKEVVMVDVGQRE